MSKLLADSFYMTSSALQCVPADLMLPSCILPWMQCYAVDVIISWCHASRFSELYASMSERNTAEVTLQCLQF